MALIDYYFSLMSPFTYLAGLRLERLAERQGASIAYKPVDLPEVFTHTGGVPLGKRSPARLAYREQELQRIARRTGLAFNLHPAHFPADPTLASCTVLAAAARTGEDETDAGALAHALLKAVWAEQKDISDPATVRAVVEELGLDPGLVDEAADHRETYQENTAEAIERGVFGSPFYIVEGEKYWGQDRLEDLEADLAAR